MTITRGSAPNPGILDHEEIRPALAGVDQASILLYIIEDELECPESGYHFERAEKMRVPGFWPPGRVI